MYVYAFCQTPPTPLALPGGIAGLIQVVTANQLSAIVEPAVSLEHLQQDDALLIQAALAHDRVVHRLFLQTTTLPLRFGTCFRSLPSLLAHLETQQQTYLNQLAKLDGKAEYTLKLSPVERPEADIAPALKGKDYFLAKKQQYQAQLSYQQQQQTAIEQMQQAISQTYAQYSRSETASGAQTMSLLVRRDREHQLRQHVQTLQEQYPEWQLELSVAMPPYHFVAGTSETKQCSESETL